MTTLEMRDAIGCKVYVAQGRLSVLCTVLDVKFAYGRKRFLVAPVMPEAAAHLTGNSCWVDATTTRRKHVELEAK
jgi:hypothetical protein